MKLAKLDFLMAKQFRTNYIDKSLKMKDANLYMHESCIKLISLNAHLHIEYRLIH